MKRQIRQPVTAARRPANSAARVLQSLRQLRNDLDELYMIDEDLYDSLDLAPLQEEVDGATMFVAHKVEGFDPTVED